MLPEGTAGSAYLSTLCSVSSFFFPLLSFFSSVLIPLSRPSWNFRWEIPNAARVGRKKMWLRMLVAVSVVGGALPCEGLLFSFIFSPSSISLSLSFSLSLSLSLSVCLCLSVCLLFFLACSLVARYSGSNDYHWMRKISIISSTLLRVPFSFSRFLPFFISFFFFFFCTSTLSKSNCAFFAVRGFEREQSSFEGLLIDLIGGIPGVFKVRYLRVFA